MVNSVSMTVLFLIIHLNHRRSDTIVELRRTIHMIAFLATIHIDFTSVLRLVVVVALTDGVAFFENHGVEVQNIRECRLDASQVVLIGQTQGGNQVAHFPCLLVIFIRLNLESLRRNHAGVIPEAEHFLLAVSQCRWVDIVLVKCLVVWNEERVVGTHCQKVEAEVDAEVSTVLHCPVHHAHIGIGGRWCQNGLVLIWSNHVLQNVDDTVVGKTNVVLAITLRLQIAHVHTHVLAGIVRNSGELAWNSGNKRRFLQVAHKGSQNLVVRNVQRVKVLNEVCLCVLLLAIDVDEVSTCTTWEEILLHGIVGWNKHGTDVGDGVVQARIVGTGWIILIPSWVVGEHTRS